MNLTASFSSIASVAKKEFLHIVRDWRILVLIFTLPPALTLLFGYAFSHAEQTDIPTLLHDDDHTQTSGELIDELRTNKTFAWKDWTPQKPGPPDLLAAHAMAALVIPKGWEESLGKGEPMPLPLTLDGTDTNTAPQLEGALRESLGKFEQNLYLQDVIDQLPDDVLEMGKKLPPEVRKKFDSAMKSWPVASTILYNPEERFIEYIMPGIVGLILQLLTITLMACTIARERESGTLSQLLVSPLHRYQIVIGKVLPYLGVSTMLIAMTLATGCLHFHVAFRAPGSISLLCFLFLLCSLGTGLLISTFCQTQAQAIQFSIFYLLPVFPLSGAFASLDQLPPVVHWISEAFPLTHFCRAYRIVSLGQQGISAISMDLASLLAGAVITCAGASFFLSRMQD
jgi:ABC-2 type transport system permease protein